MPGESTQFKPQLLRRLIREYIECATGFKPGNCDAIRHAVRSIASSVGGELGRDAIRLIEADGFEP
jgi:hypothetical protein